MDELEKKKKEFVKRTNELIELKRNREKELQKKVKREPLNEISNISFKIQGILLPVPSQKKPPIDLKQKTNHRLFYPKLRKRNPGIKISLLVNGKSQDGINISHL